MKIKDVQPGTLINFEQRGIHYYKRVLEVRPHVEGRLRIVGFADEDLLFAEDFEVTVV